MVRDHLLDQVAAHTLAGATASEGQALEIALIEEAMSNFHRYFLLMPTLARFELEMHAREERGQGLTADGLIALMADLFEEGYGGEVALDRERVGITWAQFHTHLYSNYYVYQYTTGIAGAHALLAGIRAEGQPAVDRYLAFLSAGSSVYPLEALQAAGVDLSSPEPIQEAFDYMADLIDRLALLLGVSGA
jgi:oligoendopeptidase F